MANGIFKLKKQLLGVIQKAWTGSQTTPAVEYLVVAGGGGGGSRVGAGGGAGGLLQGITPVVTGSSITVTVGAGGAAADWPSQTNNGLNSVFGSINATGGGGGGGDGNGANYPKTGGSGGGGGGSISTYGASGVLGQGNKGGNGGGTAVQEQGGGGGAGTIGLNGIVSVAGGNGGAGISSVISGTLTAYAGGGGGGARGTPAGLGGVGGGANGTNNDNQPTGATVNTGGGGGGTGYASGFNYGGAGGSGIVIISYPDTYNAPTTLTGTYTASTSGSGSFYLNGSSYLQYAGQSAFAFGTGDFTVEFWIYQPSLLGAICLDFRPATGVNGAYGSFELNTNGQLNYYANSAYRISSATGVLIAGTWQHIALTRSSTSTKLFVNGTQVGSTYSDSTNYSVGSTSPFIGAGSAANAFVTGYISNFRVVKGTAVYTANFTTPTAPLTAITNTSLLLGTVSPNQYLDSSTNAYNPTITGSPTWNQLSPFATGLGYKNRVYTWTASGTITF